MNTNTSISRDRVYEIYDAIVDYDGDNLWQDYIWGLDEVDVTATEANDISHRGEVVVLVDGTEIIWAGPREGWVIEW